MLFEDINSTGIRKELRNLRPACRRQVCETPADVTHGQSRNLYNRSEPLRGVSAGLLRVNIPSISPKRRADNINKMSPKGKERTTRNSSQTRNSQREPSGAVPSAMQQEMATSDAFSPPQGESLPGGKQNKNKSAAGKGKTQVGEQHSHITSPHEMENEGITLSNDNTNETGRGLGIGESEEQKEAQTTSSRSTEVDDIGGKEPHGDKQQQGQYSNQEKDREEFFYKSKPGEPWHETFLELQAIRATMNKLDRIDTATSTLTEQMSSVLGKTTELENKVETNATQVKDLKAEINTLKDTVAKQGEMIRSITNLKDDYKRATRKTIEEMNDLIQQQKDQVDSFHDKTDRLKKDILVEVDGKIEDLSQNLSHKELKNQAFRNRHNLVITGLEEEQGKSPKKAAEEYIESSLKIKDVKVTEAYRVGAPPAEGSSYHRPLVLKFSNLAHRNKVWKGRVDLTSDKDDHKIRVQADLPKKLREEVRVLYRVAKAAAASQKFKSAFVRDYAFFWKGQEYTPNQLEHLPRPLRPSTLASKSSEQALIFFSRHTFLSNHHPSVFKIKGVRYNNVEQFLAHKRATLSGQEAMIQKALKTTNPSEAKSLLNNLKNDHAKEWDEGIDGWAIEGVRAKFLQNEELAEKLCHTGDLLLGEASRDKRWGIGMDLSNPEALDTTKWPESSNLLGRTLMEVRKEIQNSRRANTNNAVKEQ